MQNMNNVMPTAVTPIANKPGTVLSLLAHRVRVAQGVYEKGSHQHKCKELTADCFRCKVDIENFALLPPAKLNEVLTDVQAKKARFTVGMAVASSYMDRTTHKGKRAKADVAVATRVLRGFTSRGGKV